MLQYIHEGHQGKERCLLRARNTIFWPKITYDIQELIERCIICQEHGKSQSIIGTTQKLPPFPWHTLATDIFYWKRMDFLIVADVFSKYFLVRKLANSSSAAVCAEIATIVTELGLPHIIRSDNGPCYCHDLKEILWVTIFFFYFIIIVKHDSYYSGSGAQVLLLIDFKLH